MAQFISLETFIEHQGKVNAAIGAVGDKNVVSADSPLSEQTSSAQTASLSLFASILQDALVRDHIHVEDEEEILHTIEGSIDADVHKNYALRADVQLTSQQNKLGEMLNGGHLADFNLSRMLWPTLLSQHNDAYRLDEDVVANASYHAQDIINNGDNADLSEKMFADPLKLYDILQTLKMRNAS